MRMRAPRLGDQFPEITIAEDQLEYMPITVAPVVFEDGASGLCSRWTFTPEERAAIAAGEDVYLTQLTFGQPMQPLSMSVGRPDWTQSTEEAGDAIT